MKREGAPDRNDSRAARSARLRAREIVRHRFGVSPRVLEARGGGLSNFVFEFRIEAKSFIVRLNPAPHAVESFLRQRWAMDAARGAGIAVPEVLEVGTEPQGHAFMIIAKADGIAGQDAPARMRLSLARQLGEIAKKLHTIRTRGHGTTFDWSDNTLSHRATWGDWLERDFEVERRLGLLAKLRLVEPAALRGLRRSVAEMRRWTARPVLQHRDLRLKNVIADPKDGRIVALLDWDDCLSAPPPWPELAIALHDLWLDAREAFLEGYGLKPAAYLKLVPHLRAINALQYATAAEHAAKRGDRARIEWMRLRLSGALNLHVG